MNTRTNKEPIEKPWQRVLLFRVAFGLAIMAMILSAVVALYGASQKSTPIFMMGWLCAAPCILFNVLTAFSCGVFAFDYSWLGRLTPAQTPTDWQSLSSLSSGVRIPNHFKGFASFQFGPGGIRVRVLIYTPVFIPSKQIVAVANDSWGYVRIDHASPEIRSPILVWRGVAQEMERCMPELSLVRS